MTRTLYWVQLVFYWIVSIPCFILLVMAWIVSEYVQKDETFTLNSVKLIQNAFIILFVSSCILLIGTAVFTIIKWNPYALIHFLIGVVGILLSFVVYVVSTFIEKRKNLKEENDSIL